MKQACHACSTASTEHRATVLLEWFHGQTFSFLAFRYFDCDLCLSLRCSSGPGVLKAYSNKITFSIEVPGLYKDLLLHTYKCFVMAGAKKWTFYISAMRRCRPKAVDFNCEVGRIS